MTTDFCCRHFDCDGDDVIAAVDYFSEALDIKSDK